MLMILWMLPILILVAILVAILFIAFVAIAISLVGGISVAALVKNKDVKKFLIMGFCIIFLTGLMILTPIIAKYIGIGSTVSFVISCILALIILVISIVGMILSVRLNNKIAKVAVSVVFFFEIVGTVVVFLFLIAGQYMNFVDFWGK